MKTILHIILFLFLISCKPVSFTTKGKDLKVILPKNTESMSLDSMKKEKPFMSSYPALSGFCYNKNIYITINLSASEANLESIKEISDGTLEGQNLIDENSISKIIYKGNCKIWYFRNKIDKSSENMMSTLVFSSASGKYNIALDYTFAYKEDAEKLIDYIINNSKIKCN